MRYFAFIGVGFLAALLPYSGLFALALGVPPTPSALRVAGWYEHKLEIAARTAGPRIVTIAGSNGLFGISSEMIEAGTGMRAVNFSTHATITLKYLFYKARQVLRPGDIALLALEYRFYYPKDVSALFSEYVIGSDPGYLSDLPWTERIFWLMSPSFETLTAHWFQSWEEAEAERGKIREEVEENLNRHGDFRTNQPENRRPDQVAALNRVRPVPQIEHWYLSMTPDVWEQIGGFSEWCKTNDILLLATFPSVVDFPEYDTAESRKAADKMVESYERMGVEVVGVPKDFMMPRELFFDTVYHLNDEGMRIRTAKMLPDLKRHASEWRKAHEN